MLRKLSLYLCRGLGTRYTWSCTDGVITTAYWAKENTLILGQISAGSSSLLVLELVSSGGTDDFQAQEHEFTVVSSKPLNSEPTAIHCWQSKSTSMETQASEQDLDIFCCVGTLEPAVVVYKLTQGGLWDLYNESLGMAKHDIALAASPRFTVLTRFASLLSHSPSWTGECSDTSRYLHLEKPRRTV